MKNSKGVKVENSPFFKKYQPTYFERYNRLESDGNDWKTVGKTDSFSEKLADVHDFFFIDSTTLFTGLIKTSKDTFSITISQPAERQFIGSFDDNRRFNVLLITHAEKPYIELLISDNELPEDVYYLMEDGEFDLDILFHRTILNGEKGDV